MATRRDLIAWPYRLFFLTIEPLTALSGFFVAYFYPSLYLQLTHGASSLFFAATIPIAPSIVLQQLANLYFLFAVNEAVVLRSTDDVKVWKALIFGLLVADFGHLWSVRQLGLDIYWKFWNWNSMAVGNVGIVYLGAALRIAFLLGVGVVYEIAPDETKKKT